MKEKIIALSILSLLLVACEGVDDRCWDKCQEKWMDRIIADESISTEEYGDLRVWVDDICYEECKQ